MIRLLMVTDPRSRRPEIASRFPGVTFDWASEYGDDLADAVMFIGSRRIIPAELEHALRAGKHVLYAGEPTLTLAELQSLTDLARQKNLRCVVVNPDRFLPSRQIIKAQIPEKIGQPGLIRMHRWEPASSMTSNVPGPLLRDLDTAIWLAGALPNVVHAIENPAPSGRSVQVHLGFPSDGMALIGFDNRLANGDSYQSLSVIGSSGAAYADDHQNAQLLYRGGRPQAIRTDEGPKALAEMIQAFTSAIQAGSLSPPLSIDWQSVLLVGDAVAESLRIRQTIRMEGC